MRTASISASPTKDAANGVQRLVVQRQAAAIARAHAHAVQIKVVVAFGCVLSGVLGYALHRTSMSVADLDRAPITAAALGPGKLDVHIGQIQVPSEGDNCRRFHFDNRNGAVMGESVASCNAIEPVAQRTAEPTRAEAIMNAFRVPR